MGIVINQSIKNTLVLFIGFAIGGINVLFLYTHFLEAEYFGLITFLLSSANMIMPLMVFGMQHAIIKFFSAYRSKGERDQFLLSALVLPLLVILPLSGLGAIAYDQISGYISRENSIIESYTGLIFLIAIFMGYFEIFYAWSRIHLHSVFGNFIKEVFGRICVTVLLLGVHAGFIDSEQFIYAVVGVYCLRMLIMKIYAFSLYLPPLKWRGWPENLREIISFSLYIIMAGSAGTILLEIDKFMIPQLKDIREVAYYSVGVYIASVIAIPSRAMQQIINPLTAKDINQGKMIRVEHMYEKSSINLLIAGGLLFLLINININELYMLINRPEYSVGIRVVLIISVAELIKLSLGTNGAILTNSRYFKMLFYYAIGMAISVIILNRIFIDLLGIEGAALATLMVVLFFSVLKVVYVLKKMKIQPYSIKTLKLMGLIFGLFVLSFFIPPLVHPLLTMIVKSFLISVVFIWVLLRFNLSDELNGLWYKWKNNYFKN